MNSMAKPYVTRIRAAMLLLSLSAVTISQSASAVINPGIEKMSGAYKAITAFGFTNPAVTGTVNATSHTIALTVPSGTDVTALTGTFTTTGASVKVGSTTQASGTTANDFTGPVTYTVTAEDGTIQDYTVTVTVTAAKPSRSHGVYLTLMGFSQSGQAVLMAQPDSALPDMKAGNEYTLLDPKTGRSYRLTYHSSQSASEVYCIFNLSPDTLMQLRELTGNAFML
ncbi:MAG: hypothetical protein HGB04_08395 [Chlorobiaceae bacterium]|nr:hypothetical protein [Chlorobiaceae bacterium]